MSNELIRCPGFCIKIIKDENGKDKKIPGYLIETNQEKPTGRLFCTTNDCPFAYRDEHGKDIWVSNADLLKIPTVDPLLEVNI